MENYVVICGENRLAHIICCHGSFQSGISATVTRCISLIVFISIICYYGSFLSWVPWKFRPRISFIIILESEFGVSGVSGSLAINVFFKLPVNINECFVGVATKAYCWRCCSPIPSVRELFSFGVIFSSK
jgi:hypothetical protein